MTSFGGRLTCRRLVRDLLSQQKNLAIQVDDSFKVVTKNLKFTPDIWNGDDGDNEIGLFGPNGNIGFVDAKFSRVDETLIISKMGTEEQFQGKRVIQTLFGIALARFPSTKIIHIKNLVWDNRDKLTDFLSAGYSLEDAVKGTPAYRSAAHFGFTEIIPDSILHDYSFKVQKP
jgi:hypothetical protein